MNKITNYSNLIYYDLFFCIFISVTPLLSTFAKISISIIYILLNYRYLASAVPSKFIFVFGFVFLLIFSYVVDFSRYGFNSFYEPLSIFFSCFILVGFIVSQKYPLHLIMTAFEKVSFYLCLISLLFFCLVLIKPSLLNYSIDYSYYHTTHKTVLFQNFLVLDGNFIQRNTGIASEPGLFQIIVSIGLFSCVFLNKNFSLLRFAIYSATLLSTVSTAAIISLIILFLYSMRFSYLKLFIFLIILIVFNGVVFSYLSYHIDNKLFGSLAFAARIEPLIFSFDILKSNFYGFGNFGVNYFGVSSSISYESFGQIAVRYGYLMLFWLLFCLFFVARFSLVFAILLFIFSSTQLVWFTPLVTLFYFSVFPSKRHL